jgi:hypothetical protein
MFEVDLTRRNDLRPTKPLTDNIGQFPFNMFVPTLVTQDRKPVDQKPAWAATLAGRRWLGLTKLVWASTQNYTAPIAIKRIATSSSAYCSVFNIRDLCDLCV